MYFSGNAYTAELILTVVMNDSMQNLNLFPKFTAIFIKG